FAALPPPPCCLGACAAPTGPPRQTPLVCVLVRAGAPPALPLPLRVRITTHIQAGKQAGSSAPLGHCSGANLHVATAAQCAAVRSPAAGREGNGREGEWTVWLTLSFLAGWQRAAGGRVPSEAPCPAHGVCVSVCGQRGGCSPWVSCDLSLSLYCAAVSVQPSGERLTAGQQVLAPHPAVRTVSSSPHDSSFPPILLSPSIPVPAALFCRRLARRPTCWQHALQTAVAMPVRVLVTLPPMDGPAVTEAALAEQVLDEFTAARRAGSAEELPCSVSSLRLQQATRQRYPVAYERLVFEGRWRGKWHRFAEEVVGLHCFLYMPLDYAEACGLWAHTAPNELRCCLVGEDLRVVRQADEDMGARLRERLLHKGALHRFCDAALRAAQADAGAGGAGRARWRAPPLAPALRGLAKGAPYSGCGGGAVGRLRRGAAREVAGMLVAEDSQARHVGVSRLRRHVAQCLETWVPADSVARTEKGRFMAALG
ncbi:uncharacterized protein Tco025E_06401, partial [Trypanosoma conorhini]